ncbi:unnamed protein product [Owenia fusiformis]|uniref:Consortin N-terminal domain-containing protein n=1 Tax=Owenia fusiformis TaxID=6347 RepID=A0A8S4PDD2_OWEFU|nr:unnamed protein product [Owenia fusiformis]
MNWSQDLENTKKSLEEDNPVEDLAKKDDDDEEEEESLGFSMKDVYYMETSGRVSLYERGCEYLVKKKRKLALRCFLGCLTGLKENSGFPYLPQCLHKVADIYFEQEEYQKAIQFIQAEKMYYESALIDTSELQQKLEERRQQKQNDSPNDDDPHANKIEVLRADEYENLARVCMEKQQAQLALEYQGKATKLRQQVYGDDHPKTNKSLDFFTVLYGEVGKRQYTDSMKKFTDMPVPPGAETLGAGSPGLRNRKTGEGADSTTETTQATSTQSVQYEEPEVREQEEWISQSLLLILLLVCSLVLGAMLAFVYCQLTPMSTTCATIKNETNYYFLRLKYYYYYYTKKSSG